MADGTLMAAILLTWPGIAVDGLFAGFGRLEQSEAMKNIAVYGGLLELKCQLQDVVQIWRDVIRGLSDDAILDFS